MLFLYKRMFLRVLHPDKILQKRGLFSESIRLGTLLQSPRPVLLELERVPDLAWRPEEKLVVNKPNTRYYPGPNVSQARELFAGSIGLQIMLYIVGSSKAQIFWELVKHELTYLTTQSKLELDVSYPEGLVTQKSQSRSRSIFYIEPVSSFTQEKPERLLGRIQSTFSDLFQLLKCKCAN